MNLSACPPSLAPSFLGVEGPAEDRDLILKDQESFWITVNGVSVYVLPTPDGVEVQLYPPGQADRMEPIDACRASLGDFACECGTKAGFSTPCGTQCRECYEKHRRHCKICDKERL